MPVIYLDMVLLVNFVMDLLILVSTGLCLRLPFKPWRVAAAALVGALYAVLVVLPPLPLLAGLGMKVLYSLLMLAVAFPWQSWAMFGKTVACFYLISFLAGGAVVGGVYLFQDLGLILEYNGILVLRELPAAWLLAGVAVVGLASTFGLSLFRRHLQRSRYSVPVVLVFGDERIAARALVDTGNHLRDPLNQQPVVVAEEALLRGILPRDIRCLFRVSGELRWDEVEAWFRGTGWERRVRLLPFHSLGTARGMLLGFQCDGLYVDLGREAVFRPRVTVALYPGRLAPDGQYRALLHPELLEVDVMDRKGVA